MVILGWYTDSGIAISMNICVHGNFNFTNVLDMQFT